MKLKCVYESNINGFRIDNIDMDDKRSEAVQNVVVDFANELCDEDGMFEGNIEDVKRTTIEAVSQHFGPEFEVEFEEDNFTS